MAKESLLRRKLAISQKNRIMTKDYGKITRKTPLKMTTALKKNKVDYIRNPALVKFALDNDCKKG